ncbi:MAG: N-acetylmuramic acid 6-phosphate etherase [Reichenbachiella sp.]
MSTTESSSKYNDLQHMNVKDILTHMNEEDQTVPHAVNKVISKIELLVNEIVMKMRDGGRLFYIGAGTSGRLGVVDASEIPPTFGLDHGKVVGLIAGGDSAIRKAVEFAEDDKEQAWKDLENFKITKNDVLVGIAASGRTPYVIGGINAARKQGLITGCIVCNENSELSKASEYPIEVVVGPEFVTGSTRMKSGTAQKLVLNMISTAVMIRLGHVQGNKMVDMQLSNDKLIDRASRMVMDEIRVNRSTADDLIKKHGSVRKAIEYYRNS